MTERNSWAAGARPAPRYFLVDRIFDALPWNPLFTAVPLAMLVYTGFLALEWMSGQLAVDAGRPVWARTDLWAPLFHSFAIFYIPAAFRYGLRAGLEDIRRLRPVLMISDAEFEDRVRRHWGTVWPNVGGALGLATYVIVVIPGLFGFGNYLQATSWSHDVIWFFCWNCVLYWSFGKVAFLNLQSIRRMRELLTSPHDVDLMRLETLHPYASIGLRNAFIWIFGLSLATPIVVDTETLSEVVVSISWIASIAAIGGAVGLVPLFLLRRVIRDAKAQEIHALSRAIDGNRESLEETRIASQARTASLTDLLSYRQYVESVSEMPFAAASVVRIAVFVGIPIASWVGGALVERTLGSLLD